MGPAVSARLYAATSTDTGHAGGAATFVVDHPEKVIDFSYRAVHEMTIAAKGDQRGVLWWWSAALLFPGMLDGRPSGTDLRATVSPGLRRHHRRGERRECVLSFTERKCGSRSNRIAMKASLIPQNRYAALHDGVLAACDALDGVKDRVIEDPGKCRFDPAVLLCKEGDSATCLTAPQVETAKTRILQARVV
jgi:feruloyl esterase